MSGKPTVHPRIRGERRFGKSARAEEIGSSPHARGTRYRASARQLSQRFIPACAGNASPCQVPTMIGAVHPRIRGERTWGMITPSGLAGSSPHTRGTRDGKTCGDDDFRFIPAYAGNASGRARRASTGTVHPRIRGERTIAAGPEVFGNGSSPHTRGTQQTVFPGGRDPRFIPAYAGNARRTRQRARARPVHPRIRGERSFAPGRVQRKLRFIPAYAGNARREDLWR